ncbi:hypothetical protein ACF073_37845 [Streptomyces sp. NPDC015171]|uniref:hypothetical protein n=1 Tax=Streptomyces sp. NPDC015171 TaxID=3364945 RepID=UPI0036FEBF5F
MTASGLALRTVSRPKGAKGFVVVPRRWKVERTLGWLTHARRNVRDYERLPQHSESHLTWALFTVMFKRLTRKRPAPAWTRKTKPAPDQTIHSDDGPSSPGS